MTAIRALVLAVAAGLGYLGLVWLSFRMLGNKEN